MDSIVPDEPRLWKLPDDCKIVITMGTVSKTIMGSEGDVYSSSISLVGNSSVAKYLYEHDDSWDYEEVSNDVIKSLGFFKISNQGGEDYHLIVKPINISAAWLLDSWVMGLPITE